MKEDIDMYNRTNLGRGMEIVKQWIGRVGGDGLDASS